MIKPMKLLYLVYGTHSGIVPSHARALRELGVSVEIWNVGDGLDYRCKHAKFPSLAPRNIRNSIEAISRYGKDWRWFYKRTDYAFRWMSQQARNHAGNQASSFDVIMQSGVLFNGNPGPAGNGVPYVLHLDHTYALSKAARPLPFLPNPTPASARWERMEHETYRDADLILSMSDSVKRSLLADYGIPEEKVIVVGGGPNLAELPDLGEPGSSRPTVLFVGKDFERKGGTVLLKAFALARERIPDATLRIIGPSEPVRAPGVEFLGPKSHAEMPEFYQDSDVFVMPSWREPFGIAYIEAMAHGLPCIGTNIEAIPEIIDHGTTGFLVNPGDEAALAGRMIELLGDTKRAREMGHRGRLRVEQKLNWRVVARTMRDAFARLLERN